MKSLLEVLILLPLHDFCIIKGIQQLPDLIHYSEDKEKEGIRGEPENRK